MASEYRRARIESAPTGSILGTGISSNRGLIGGDIHDGPLLDRLFREYRFTAAVHFPTFAWVAEARQDPGKSKLYSRLTRGHFLHVQALNRGNVPCLSKFSDGQDL